VCTHFLAEHVLSEHVFVETCSREVAVAIQNPYTRSVLQHAVSGLCTVSFATLVYTSSLFCCPTQVHTHTHTHTHATHTITHTHTYTHTHTQTHTHTRTNTHVHAQTHIHIVYAVFCGLSCYQSSGEGNTRRKEKKKQRMIIARTPKYTTIFECTLTHSPTYVHTRTHIHALSPALSLTHIHSYCQIRSAAVHWLTNIHGSLVGHELKGVCSASLYLSTMCVRV